MTEKKPLARAAPGQLVGRKLRPGREAYRIVGPDDKPLLTKDHTPVDGGGYDNKNLAVMRAGEINEYYDKLAKEVESRD